MRLHLRVAIYESFLTQNRVGEVLLPSAEAGIRPKWLNTAGRDTKYKPDLL